MIQDLTEMQFNLYQSLNISICNTSCFPSKAAGAILLTTESLYKHMNLGGCFREISSFMKGLGPARFSQARP